MLSPINPTRELTARAESCDPCVERGFWIPEQNVPALRAEIDRLAKRAARLGTGAITLRETAHESWTVRRAPAPDGYADVSMTLTRVRFTRFVRVFVSGPRVRLAGWQFVATLQHRTTDDGASINVVRRAPGSQSIALPDSARTAPQRCDHCRTNRLRNDTYVLAHDDGRTVQVGSTCLCDFVGDASALNAATMASYLADAMRAAEDSGDGTDSLHERGDREAPTLSMLAFAAYAVRTWGWVPASSGRDDTTRATVCARMYARNLPREEQWSPEERDFDAADAALEWVRSLGRETRDLSDYEWNLYAACSSGFVAPRTEGIVCSAIAAHQRIVAKRAETERYADSRHMGVTGERMRGLSIRVLGVWTRESDEYGVSTLVRFVTDTGCIGTWFASGDVTDAWKVNESYAVDATVKRHDVRQGRNETIFNRVALAKPAKVRTRKARVAA